MKSHLPLNAPSFWLTLPCLWTLLVQAKKLGRYLEVFCRRDCHWICVVPHCAVHHLVRGKHLHRFKLRIVAGEVGQFAFLIAVLAGYGQLRSAIPWKYRLSSEAVAQSRTDADNKRVTKRHAAVGIQVNEPEEESEDPAKLECGAHGEQTF